MVNHIQTLLANVSSEEAKKLCLSFTVDTHFIPKKLPYKLNKARLDLLRTDIDASILAAMRVISRLDLSKYTGRYDRRLDVSNFDGAASIVLGGESVDFSKFMAKENINYLFSKTWNAELDSLLDELYNTLKNDVDGYTGVAAAILALVARLDLAVRL